MRMTKKKNKRTQKPDEDRKHASDDDEGGEEQDEDEDEGPAGTAQRTQQVTPAEPEHSAAGSHPEGDKASRVAKHPAKNAAPDTAGRPTGPPLLCFIATVGSARPPSKGG